jgi:hypothetical protein
MPEQPAYAVFGGATIPAPPYLCTDATLWSFVTLGDEAAIKSYLARSLNAITTPNRFIPVLGPLVFVLKIDCGALTSATPPFAGFGTTAETDIGFWLLVADTQNHGIIYWYPAYLFVDNWLALIAGREVWGFPKALCSVTETPENGGTISVSTLALKSETPTDKAVEAEIFSISPIPIQNESLIEELGGGLLALIAACATKIHAPAWAPNLLQDLANLLPTPKFGGFLLIKQFRDAASPTTACYQSPIAVLPTLNGLPRSGGISGTTCQLTLQTYASQPIAQDLGLQPGPQDALALAWSTFDFGLGFGVLV